MKYKAVIFDLDGTLLNTIEDLADSVNELLASLNLPVHQIDSYKKFVGSGAEILLTRSLPDYYKKNCDIKDLTKKLREIYTNKITQKTKPYDGINELLTKLNEMKININVLSNKPDRETKLAVQHFFKNHSFKIVRGAIDNKPLKPDPACALEIAEINNIDPKNFIYLGDSDIDMITAKNAGMFSVGVLWGFRDKKELIENGAQSVISKPMELINII